MPLLLPFQLFILNLFSIDAAYPKQRC